MRFFRIHQPEAASDYAHTWLNGSAEAQVGFPGVECSVCGETRGLAGGVLPYRLPDVLTWDPRLRSFWPIPETEHRSLIGEVEQALAHAHPDLDPLPGGAMFPPISWTLPSRPEGDVFWASLEGPIVSARIATALRSSGAKGFALIPVDEIRCGTQPASQDAPIPESGEPEDLAAWATTAPESGSEFFMLSVLAAGNLTSNMEAHAPCTGCGNVEIDRAGDWAVWDDGIWAGDDIFLFPTTRYIIATERIADLLIGLDLVNVEFVPLTPGEPVAEDPFEKLAAMAAEQPVPEDAGPVPEFLGPAITGRLAEPEDVEWVTRHLTDLGLVVAPVSEQEESDTRTPDLRIKDDGGSEAYVLVASLGPDELPRPQGGWVGAVRGFLGIVAGRDAAQHRFDRLAPYVYEAIRRFDAVNRDRDLANVLVLVDHVSGISANDLYDVLTAEDGAKFGALRGDPDGRTKGVKLRLDLCLWMDPVLKHTEHFHLPRIGRADDFIFLYRLYGLGEE